MYVVAGIVPVFAIVFFGGILTFVLVRLSSIQTQKKARLEMKRHLQKNGGAERA
jgi:preprotein translocase subunit YajC